MIAPPKLAPGSRSPATGRGLSDRSDHRGPPHDSSHFALMPYSKLMKPVALPPGRARLSTKPAATGSGTATNTMGMERVASNNGPTVTLPVVKMTSGASATNSAAYLRARSPSVAPQRMSICTLRPTSQPHCCRPWANAVWRACASGSSTAKVMSSPMRRTRSRCCARAASGHAAAAPPSSVMNARRSFDHLVGAGEQLRRKLEAERIGSLEVHHHLELGRLLHGKIGRMSTLEDLIHVSGGPSKHVSQTCPI